MCTCVSCVYACVRVYVRLVVPSDTSTSDQAATAAERGGSVGRDSHPLLAQLSDKELGRLKAGALAMRSLVRVKVADDAGAHGRHGCREQGKGSRVLATWVRWQGVGASDM
jgi:hypothetical protein